ncbi:MAG: T9SS type A sorting domain-containing protein [Candidatus Cloacimonetes bacterium]|nr:T9SS type A sorting domain-containing protein [Candidatus Cloacimonadota bacterium]
MKKQLLVLVFMLCLSIFAYAQNNLIVDSSTKEEDIWITDYPYFMDFEDEEVGTLPYGWDAKYHFYDYPVPVYVKAYSSYHPIWQSKYLYSTQDAIYEEPTALYINLPKIENPQNKYFMFNACGNRYYNSMELRMVSNYSFFPEYIDIATVSYPLDYKRFLFKLPDTEYNILQFYRQIIVGYGHEYADPTFCLEDVEIGIIPEVATSRIFNTEIDFERLYQGNDMNIALPIFNTGSEPLIVNATSSEHFSPITENLTIQSVESEELLFHCNTEMPGYYEEQIILNTNDSQNPQYIINCKAEVVPAPSYGNIQFGFENNSFSYPFNYDTTSWETLYTVYSIPNNSRGRISTISYDYASAEPFSYNVVMDLYASQTNTGILSIPDSLFTRGFEGVADFNNETTWTKIQLDTPFEIDKNYLIIRIKSSAVSPDGNLRCFYFSHDSNYDTFNFDMWHQGGPNIALFFDNIAFKTPNNFEASLVDNDVNLSWVAPIYPNDIEDLPVLSGYNVYRNDEIIATLDETQLSYTDNELDNSLINTYYLTAVYTNPEGESMPTVKRTFNPTGIEDVVNEASLSISSYPNPVKDLVHIALKLHNNTQLKIEIFNIKGQKVKTLFNEECKSGDKLITWDTKDDNDKLVSSGVYFYKVSFDNLSQMKKMLIMR